MNLKFNALSFPLPTEPETFYFSNQPSSNSKEHRLHYNACPQEVIDAFPAPENPQKAFYYTTFGTPSNSMREIALEFSSDSRSFYKRLFNHKIHQYFQGQNCSLVKGNFIDETEVWLEDTKSKSENIKYYHKFTIKTQFRQLSKAGELVISYDGKAQLAKESVDTLLEQFGTGVFTKVLYQGQLLSYDEFCKQPNANFKEAYPKLNPALRTAMQLPFPKPDLSNKYLRFTEMVGIFIKRFLANPEFQELVPLHSTEYIKPRPITISQCSSQSNKLQFKGGTGAFPLRDMYKLKPLHPSPHNGKVHIFYIVHHSEIESARRLVSYFKNGVQHGKYHFPGLKEFIGLNYFTTANDIIQYQNKDNPLPEILNGLEKYKEHGTTYFAVYLSPHSKYEPDAAKRNLYYQIKEVLLQKEILSQVIELNKLKDAGNEYLYSLNNIAVAILAKLGGTPWLIDTKKKTEIIVGVGAHKNREKGKKYIGSSFAFNNLGQFNRQSYFTENQIDLLAGSIELALRAYYQAEGEAERLVIHFYKDMSNKELKPILDMLDGLHLSIPVFVVTINKTESKQLMAFNSDWNQQMPLSGTYINVGKLQFLLFNNSHYNEGYSTCHEGYPFPVKLKIDCSQKELLEDEKTITGLIDQVYQFSRIYWKSVKQQNLPVTIKYPTLVAEIAPHFKSGIPDCVSDKLWLL